ncbi:MAG: hypothetical protein R3C24_06170 [Cyanobacteriota/Melainabacteria group bacterium]
MHDPLLKRANDACMRVTREKTSLVSRFSPGELDRLKQTEEREKAIMHRKPKIAKKRKQKLLQRYLDHPGRAGQDT